jgi:hypothetical protein
MKKNDVFTFTAPNGVEVTGVVVGEISCRNEGSIDVVELLCYAQNRLFVVTEEYLTYIDEDNHEQRVLLGSTQREVLVNYAILPDYDSALAEY